MPTPITMRPALSSRISWLILLMICLASAGCGLTAQQKAAVGQFSAATIEISDLSTREIASMRQQMIDFRQRMLELGSAVVDENDLDGPMDLDDAQARIAAAAALNSYGQLLSTLIFSDRDARIQAATTAFLTNLRQVKGVEFPEQKASAIQKLVLAGAQLALEAHRKKVLREVVVETYQPIRKLSSLLRADFNPDDLGWAGALAANDKSISDLGRRMATLSTSRPFNERTLTQADIALYRSNYETLRLDSRKAIDDLRLLQSRIVSALDEFDKAHEGLYYLVQHEQITSEQIGTYYQKVAELIQLYKLIRGRSPS